MNSIRIKPAIAALLVAFPILGSVFSTSAASTLFVPLGATWKYLDNGSNQGTTWTRPDFNDSSWRSGCAQLGYGDGDECTVVGYGPDPLHKYVTTYFRRQFVVANAAQYVALSIQLLRDDGAVVYLNGTEVFRSNMPEGPILYNTTASRSAIENIFVTSTFCATRLAEGTNILAVEIHQVNPDSSDISFDMSLEGLTVLTPDVRITQPEDLARFPGGTPIQFSADASEPCGAIRTVEFYQGNTKLGEVTSSPFQFTWTNAPFGNSTIQAVAINEFGTRGTSAPVHVRVLVGENTPLLAQHSVWKYLDNG